MQFLTEEMAPIHNVTSSAMAEILAADAFGGFAVLQVSDDEFLQAGNNWSPSDDCAAFLRQHDSDPWLLEYRDPTSGKLLRAEGDHTLSRVTEIFLAFLAGDRLWRSGFTWSEVEL